MRFTYSQAYREAVASVDSTAAYIETISFFHASFAQTYRYCASDTDLIIEGDTYKGKQFALTEGEDSGLQVTVSNVTSQVYNIFKTAKNSKTPILVEPKRFVADRPAATGSYATKLFVKNVSFSSSDMVLVIGYPDTTNLKLPKENYTTWESPGLR